jgi:hypothetical protein
LRELSVVAECGNGQTTDSRNSLSEPLSVREFPEPPELVALQPNRNAPSSVAT